MREVVMNGATFLVKIIPIYSNYYSLLIYLPMYGGVISVADHTIVYC